MAWATCTNKRESIKVISESADISVVLLWGLTQFINKRVLKESLFELDL